MAHFQPFKAASIAQAPQLMNAEILQHTADQQERQGNVGTVMEGADLYNQYMGAKSPIGDALRGFTGGAETAALPAAETALAGGAEAAVGAAAPVAAEALAVPAAEAALGAAAPVAAEAALAGGGAAAAGGGLMAALGPLGMAAALASALGVFG